MKLPTGTEYLEHARQIESDCELASDTEIAKAGTKAPECLATFSELLVRMDAVASCFWCCLGGDHRLEYLAGRLVSSSRASLSLLRRGFYDESLNLTRSVGELANLLFLFAQDRSILDSWAGLNDGERRREFSPVKVRLALEAKGLPIPIDKERYSSLSEVATHFGPRTRPNAHSPDQRPRMGGYFDLASSIAALNELAGAFAIGSFSVAQLVALPNEHKQEVMVCARKPLNSVGAVSLATLRMEKLSEAKEP